jgi:hypothetical protein
MQSTLSGASSLLKRPEFLTILVCIALLLSGFLPVETRSTIIVGAIALVAVVSLITAFNSASACKSKMRILKSHKYSVNESELIELDSTDAVVGRINLSTPYDASIPFSGNAEGVYRVKQGDQTVYISSEAENAEHLVRNVLGIRTWPPDARLNGP